MGDKSPIVLLQKKNYSIMIQLDELAINNYKELIVTVTIKDSPYYENVFIDKIIIDNQDTFSITGPSDNPVYSSTVSGNQKSITLTIPDSSILASLDSDLLIVYVIAKGTPSSNTPCSQDNNVIVKAITNWYYIYCRILNLLKREHPCDINKAFIDEFLRYKLIHFAIMIGDMNTAVRYFIKFYKKRFKPPHINRCRCNE